jgi:hypothetical protein
MASVVNAGVPYPGYETLKIARPAKEESVRLIGPDGQLN